MLSLVGRKGREETGTQSFVTTCCPSNFQPFQPMTTDEVILFIINGDIHQITAHCLFPIKTYVPMI